MKRTDDVAFLECPLCNKKPRLDLSSDKCAIARCDGTFIRKHDPIIASVIRKNPTEVKHIRIMLAYSWNYEVKRYGYANLLLW